MRRANVPAALRDRPFTTREAAAAGLTPAMLRSACWRRLFRGVYVHRDVPDTRELRAQAVALVLDPDVFLCGISAAWLYGVDLHRFGEALPSLWVACHNGRKARPRPGWTVQEMTVEPEDLHQVNGIPVTSPVRTAFDCARWLPLTEAVVVLDKLARDRLLRLDEVASYAAKQYRIRGKRSVARVVEWADPRSMSPQESRLRVWLRLEGLAAEPQYPVRDETGKAFAYIDLAFVAEKVAIEYQGSHHEALGPEDERRRQRLLDFGWEVIYVYKSDLATAAARQALFFRIRSHLAARSAAARPTARSTAR